VGHQTGAHRSSTPPTSFGGATTVTATFGTAITSWGIIYIHEYAGLAKVSPVDVTKSAIGTGSTMSSGSVATRNATDLLFAFGGRITG
jgi:hypothetical protein